MGGGTRSWCLRFSSHATPIPTYPSPVRLQGWHVDLGKSFGDRGLDTGRTLASCGDHAAVVLFLVTDTAFRGGVKGIMACYANDY